ncbi:MAG: diacylglycerol kinase [Pseudomonadota bacterium]
MTGAAHQRKPDHRGLYHVVMAMVYSGRGLAAAWRQEEAFRLELLVAAFMVPAGIWLGRTGVEYALLFGALVMVLLVELVNSALEAVVDRIGTEEHPLSARAKDLGSAAVFASLVLVAVIWGAVAWGRFLA